MSSGFRLSDGTDLAEIFEGRTEDDPRLEFETGFRSQEADFSDLFLPKKGNYPGIKTGFRVGPRGEDVGELFELKRPYKPEPKKKI